MVLITFAQWGFEEKILRHEKNLFKVKHHAFDPRTDVLWEEQKQKSHDNPSAFLK